MLEIKEKGLVIYITEHCKRIEKTLADIDEQEFYTNDDVKEIICFNLLQIGELVNKFSDLFYETYPGVPWNKIRGLRNRIVHAYGAIRFDRVWLTASKDIKPLKKYCESILANDKQ